MAATMQAMGQAVKPGPVKPWAWPGTGMQGDTMKPIGAGAGIGMQGDMKPIGSPWGMGDRGAASGWNGGASGDFAGGPERYAALAATLAGMKPPAGDPFANWFGGMKPPTGSVGFTDSVGGGMKPPASATTSDGTALWGVGSGAFSGMKPPAGLNGGPKPVSAWPGAPADLKPMGAPSMGSATAGQGAMLKGATMPGEFAISAPTPTFNDAPLPMDAAPSAGGYAGPTFKPGQTLTADQLPDWERWRAAGMPGTPAAQMPQAPGAVAPPAAGQSFGPQGFGSNVVNDPNSPLRGLPGIDNTTVDYATLPGLEEDFTGMGDRVRSALFQRTSGLLNPEHERAREATAQRLANAGIPEGSERWNEEMDRLDQQRSLSLERAGLDADVAAGDEMGRLFQMALARRQQLGGERERGADRSYSQTLGTRAQFAGERLGQAGIDANIAAANAQAGATASGHALQAAQAAAANDIARGRLGLDADEQAFTQWLRSGQFAREGVNMPNFGTPIPLDVTGAAGVAQSGANARTADAAARRSGYWGLAGTLLSGMFGKKGYQ